MADKISKRCPQCKLEKVVADFSGNRCHVDGLSSQCRSCDRINTKKWRIKNSVKEAFRKLKMNFGISKEIYDGMVSDQSGKCAVCGLLMTPPQVDHCHKTKEVRGLLCRFCNVGLGHFKDSPRTLHDAARYLEHSRNCYGLAQ